MSLNPSRTMMAVFIAVFLSMGMLTSVPSYAAIVSTTIDFNDNGSGTIGSTEANTITVQKTYDVFGSMFIQFVVDDDFPDVEINENIVNDTGINWTDFHWQIISGDAAFVDVVDLFPFTIEDVNPGAIKLSGGTLLAGNSFTPDLFIDIYSFSAPIIIEQFPSVPIPAALWLFGSGLLVLIGAARRRKMV